MTMATVLAAAAMLAPARPDPSLPVSWEAELSAGEAAAFDEAGDWVGILDERRRLWNAFLEMMRLKESEQCASGVRWMLEYKNRVWSFDAYGHYWSDSRFVRDDETDTLEELEGWFKKILERSPYAGFEWGVEQGETLNFRGFDDGRFNAADSVLAKVCDEFNANPPSFWFEAPPPGISSVHELHPRLLKSLLIEEEYEDYPASLDEGGVRMAIRELAACGCNEGGRFEGWFNAIKDYGAAHRWRGEDDFMAAQYAERVMRRFDNPGVFVPVLMRKGKNE